MNVLLAASASHYKNEIGQLLNLAGITPAISIELIGDNELNQATNLLKDNTTFIIFYIPLAYALELASNRKTSIEQAISLWQESATLVTQLSKQHRKNILLINLADALSSPSAFMEACRSRWPKIDINTSTVRPSPIKADIFFELLSHTLLAHYPALLALSQQLTALAQPLSNDFPAASALPVDVNLLVSHYQEAKSSLLQSPSLIEQLSGSQSQNKQISEQLKQEQQDHNITKQELDKIKKENQTLTDQLFATQEGLESRVNENSEQASHLQRLEEKNRLLEQENKLILEQLFTVQEEVEKHYLAAHKADDQQGSNDLPSSEQLVSRNKKASFLKKQLQKRADKKTLKRQLSELYSSPLFDAKWYLSRYSDIASDEKFRKNPALHYLKFGGFEGRDPGPRFSSAGYLSRYPDVKAEGFNPLIHYLRFGQAENRRIG